MRSAPFGCLALGMFLFALIIFPFVLADVMISAMGKLGLTPGFSLLAVMGMFFGGMINIPVKKVPRNRDMKVDYVDMFGFRRIFPGAVRQRSYTVIALNVGGCIVPCGIALWQIVRVAGHGLPALVAVSAAIAVNVAVCYRISRPVKNVGIAMPPFLPAAVAALCAILFLPDFAPPVAFVAGVTGPLIGADLLHLEEINRINTGMASIGGAGTFDGIVLSGLVATLLAW